MAMLGKTVRMSRLVNPKSDKMMAITVDHSISRGILEGLIPIQENIDKIVAGGPNDQGDCRTLLSAACRESCIVAEMLELLTRSADK